MDISNNIAGMNLSPIGNYNNYLKVSDAFDIDTSDFENILNQKTEAMQNPQTIKGGVQLNNIHDVAAKTSVQGLESSSSVGDFMKGVSNSINGGLNSVNDAVTKANKAQEAFAMGEDISVHDVMIASEKASLSLSMAMQLRNKLINAYNEINNVRV